MNLYLYQNIYLIGVGGIGMSALARYFNFQGKHVFGYDKVRSDLCTQLESEGINIHYKEDPSEAWGEYEENPLEILSFIDNLWDDWKTIGLTH